MSGAAKLWSTTQWRRHWPTLALAWLVLALTGALALGAATSARRAVTAFDRLREETSAAEVTVNHIDPDVLGEGTTIEEALQRLLQQIDAAGAVYQEQFFIFPVGYELFPTYDFSPIVQRQLLDHPANVPVVIAGRMPSPTEPNEIGLSQQLADLFDVGVGDSMTFESATDEWLYRSFSSADPGPTDGPTLELTVTGILVSSLDFSTPNGTVYLTTAFARHYDGQIGKFPGADVFLDDPTRAFGMIQTGSPNSGDALLDSAVGFGQSRWSDQRQVSDGLRIAAASLWIFAVAVAMAGLAVVALISRRLARAMSSEIEVLSALGVGRLDRAMFGARLFSPVIALGALATFIGAPIISPFTRLGLAEQVEPNRGTYFDWPLLIAGTIALALATFVGTVPPLRRRPSPIVRFRSNGTWSAVARGSMKPSVARPIPLTLGTRQALDFRAPSRNALISTTVLMTTVVASLVVGASLARLPARPALWGGGSDVVIDFGERAPGEANEPYNLALQTLGGNSDMAALTGTATFFPAIEGNGLAAFAIDTRRGEPIITIIAGRSAHGPDEIVLGKATMKRHHLHLGDDVALTLAEQTESFHLVGQAVFPYGDVTAFDDSLAVTAAGADRFAQVDGDTGTNQILITWADGVDETQARRELERSGYRVLDRPRLPPAVTNLTQVDQMPTLLALFFGVLGVAVLGYMLGASSRSRGRQSAVLATLGLRPRQVDSILRWQAITTAVVAVSLGLPAGIVAGRAIWNAIAQNAGVAVSYSSPIAQLAALSAALIVAALTIALALSYRPRRRSLATLLRAD